MRARISALLESAVGPRKGSAAMFLVPCSTNLACPDLKVTRAPLNPAATAPRLTGELASSRHVAPGRRSARVTFRAGHARFVEQGTRNMAAEPFLGPAADSSRAEIIA